MLRLNAEVCPAPVQGEGHLGLGPKDNDKTGKTAAPPDTSPADGDSAPTAQPSAPAPSADSYRPAGVSQIDGPDVTRAASKETPLKDTFQVRPPRVCESSRSAHKSGAQFSHTIL